MSGSKSPAQVAALRNSMHKQRYERETGINAGFSSRPDSYGSPSAQEVARRHREYNEGYQAWLKNNPVPTSGEITVNLSRRGSYSAGSPAPSASSGGNGTSGSAAPARPKTVTRSIPGSPVPQVVRWEDTPEGRQAEADKRARLDAEKRRLDRMRAGRENTLLTSSEGAAGDSGVQTKHLLGQ